MLAIHNSHDQILDTIKAERLNGCAISCLNGPRSVVVSGPMEEVLLLRDSPYLIGTKTTVLNVPYAFHSAQMDPIMNDFIAAAKNVKFSKPSIPIASTLEGMIVSDVGTFSAQYLSRQMREKVNFSGAAEVCRKSKVVDNDALWIEMGPEPICLAMIRSTLGLSSANSLPSLKSNEDCWKTIATSIGKAYTAGATINWHAYHKEYEPALRLLELPTYAFELENYWLQYRGDWALHSKEEVEDKLSAVNPVPESRFGTICLQRVKREHLSSTEATITFESDLSSPELFAAIKGHLVNGSALCPSSVYSDMAFTAASYVHERMGGSKPVRIMDLTAMEVFRPLVATQNSSQMIEVSVHKLASSDSATISFTSLYGSTTLQHATCTVIFRDGHVWKSQKSRNAYLWKSRMDTISKPSSSVTKIPKPMVYKLFSTLVVYDKKYQSLSEVFLDCTLNEAAATIQFHDPLENGTFTCNPYWIDSIVHLAGFVLNGNFDTPEDVVYISNGWESLCLFEELAAEVRYSSYVRMQSVGDRGLHVGDVYLFKENELVGIVQALKFQALPKATLHSMLENAKPSDEMREKAVAEQHHNISIKSGSQPKEESGKTVEPISTKNSSPTFAAVIEVLAAECRLPVESFKDDVPFGDLGVDSLLTVSITKALKKKLDLDLPAFLFDTDAQLSGLKDYFGDSEQSTQGSFSSEVSTEQTPDSSQAGSITTSPYSNSKPGDERTDLSETLLSIVAIETGISRAKLEDSICFADLGVDSLMSISILENFKIETGELLPANFFNDNITTKDAKKALAGSHEESKETTTPLSPPQQRQEVVNEVGKIDSQPYPGLKVPNNSTFSSKAVFIQGRPRSSLKPLFLISDGAGSAASYIKLPPFASGVPIYALESPFLHSPKEYRCTVEECATIFIHAIRKIQPSGPYMLGGWSLGGIYSYEIARQLLLLGEAVRGIVLVDSPCPKPLPNMPEPTVEMLDNAGMFAGVKKVGKADDPKTLKFKQHIVACINALRFYDPVPMPLNKRPSKVVQLWAKHKTIGRPDDKGSGAPQGAPGSNGWLKASRRSFGPNGWDKLVGDVECHVMDGDHFSVMNMPRMKLTGELISNAVDEFLKM